MRPANGRRRGQAARHGRHRFDPAASLFGSPAHPIGKGPDRPSNLTPGITRRPEPLKVHDKQRVGGRVHAVVRRILLRLFQRAL